MIFLLFGVFYVFLHAVIFFGTVGRIYRNTSFQWVLCLLVLFSIRRFGLLFFFHTTDSRVQIRRNITRSLFCYFTFMTGTAEQDT